MLSAMKQGLMQRHQDIAELNALNALMEPPRSSPLKRSSLHPVESELESAIEAVRVLDQTARDLETQCSTALEAADQHLRRLRQGLGIPASDLPCEPEAGPASVQGPASSPCVERSDSTEGDAPLTELQLKAFMQRCDNNPEHWQHAEQAYVWEFVDWAVMQQSKRASKAVAGVVYNAHLLQCVVTQLGVDYVAMSRLSRTCWDVRREVDKGQLMKSRLASRAGAMAARLGDANTNSAVDAGVRKAAVRALGELGEHASPHAGAMVALLVDGDTGVRRAAVEALGTLGEHASPHAGAMVALLRDGDWRVRMAAVEALGTLGEHASPHAGAMAALLVDGDAWVRMAAVRALGKLGEHASPHASAMAALLGDGDEDVRRAAVEALGELGEHASPHAAAMAAMS